jgi:acetoin:2,6-dichlorophenolindophenol oxidoreductase subunit beta
MTRKALMQAVRDAYIEEMTRDPRMLLIGEDVIVSLFGDTRGLRDQFGPQRVRDAPISEGALTSMAVGVAMTGRPVICHLMFSNFIYTGFDGVANQAAKLRFMTGGQVALPVTFFAVMGGGASNAAQHSDTPYPAVMNLSGINVVVPATAADAKGLMKTALRGKNPTMFLVPRSRSGLMGDIPDGEHLVPFGRATIHRPGKDITIVAIGSTVKHALEAAATLQKEGIEAEILDPRTLVPLDRESILASVARTGRLIIVDEARDCCSAASQIAAVAADEGFELLRAPIRRITVADTPMPYAPVLEKALVPNPERILASARELVRLDRRGHLS